MKTKNKRTNTNMISVRVPATLEFFNMIYVLLKSLWNLLIKIHCISHCVLQRVNHVVAKFIYQKKYSF